MADTVAWTPERKKECAAWLYEDIMRAQGARSELEDDWRGYLELYRAPQAKGVAHFPFEGASARTFPLAAMNVDPIWARYVANIHAPINLWSVAALNENWIKAAKPLQDYLTWIDQHILHMWDVNMRVFQEMCKLGTSIYKTSWLFARRRKMGYDAQKRRTRLVETINQPMVDHVHIANFLVPPEANSIDPDAQSGAVWCAERHRLTPNALRAMGRGQEPFLPNFDAEAVAEALKFEESSVTKHQQTVKELDKLSSALNMTKGRPIEFYEVHARFDTQGNGLDDDIVVFLHLPTQQVLRATYATLPMRPYSAVRYLRGDGFYGIGVCEQAKVWQDTISDILNFNIDKILLSNAPMLRVTPGANVVPDEPIFPGKQWHVGKDELEAFFLTSPGSFDIQTLISFLQESAKQRTALTDLQQGTVGSLPSRTPAMTVQALLQEGNTRFDMSIKDIRVGGLGEVGLRVLQLLQQQSLDSLNNPDGAAYIDLARVILGQPEGEEAARALQIPFEAVELGVGVTLTATSGQNNKELMKQSNLALLQLYSQMAPQFLQLAQVIQMGGAPAATAMEIFKGGAQLMGNVLEQFDIRNPEDILPSLQALLGAQQQMGPGGQGQISPMMGGMPQSQGGQPSA